MHRAPGIDQVELPFTLHDMRVHDMITSIAEPCS